MRAIGICAAVIGLFCAGCGSSESAASCADVCAKAAALHCKGGTTQVECEQKCEHPALFPGCEAQSNAYIDCVKRASSFVCAGVSAKAVGCDAAEAAFEACVLGQLGDGGPSDDHD